MVNPNAFHAATNVVGVGNAYGDAIDQPRFGQALVVETITATNTDNRQSPIQMWIGTAGGCASENNLTNWIPVLYLAAYATQTLALTPGVAVPFGDQLCASDFGDQTDVSFSTTGYNVASSQVPTPTGSAATPADVARLHQAIAAHAHH